MRLIGHLPTQQEALSFVAFLKSEGIESIIEKTTDFQIWIVNEDHLDQAADHFVHFQEHPSDPKYLAPASQPPLASPEQQAALTSEKARRLCPASLLHRSPMGKLILTLIILCIGIFAWAAYEGKNIEPYSGLGLPLFTPVYGALLYDYPKAFADIEKVALAHSPDELKEPSQEVKAILNAPFYRGFYTKVVRKAQGKPPLTHGPLFQKIRQGQVWRLITPIFLHGGFLHILLNLLWLWVLGNQIEERLGIWRTLLLVLFGGSVSNTAQYLMSGPLFFGMSGVVLTFFAFIWVRQKKAPWEGYLLNRITIAFISIWIIGIALLQVALFFFQIFGNTLPPIGIANTAHVVGALAGALCGSLNLFTAK